MYVNRLQGFNARTDTFAAGAATPTYALVTPTADVTATNFTTAAAIAFGSEVVDIGGWHDNVTNNSRLTVPAGVTKVRLIGQVGAAILDISDLRELQIKKDGSALSPQVIAIDSVEQNQARSFIISPVLDVSAGEYFELFYRVGVDTSSSIIADETWFSIEAVE